MFGRARGLPLMASARMLVETEELKPKQRQTVRALLDDFERWRGKLGHVPQAELVETVLRNRATPISGRRTARRRRRAGSRT